MMMNMQLLIAFYLTNDLDLEELSEGEGSEGLGRNRKGRGGEREEREWRANSAQIMNKRKLNLKELGWEQSGGIDV